MMKKIIAVLCCLVIILSAAGCGEKTGNGNSSAGSEENVSVVDMAGRTVTVPKKINKVFSTSAAGAIFIYSLAPEKLAGWNNELREVEKKYILPEYRELPVLGTWKGTNFTGSIEELMKVAPDVIISMGDVSPKYTADAEEIEKRLGIPVIMVDGSLKNLDQAYEFVGKLLGEESRAQKLAEYCSHTYAEIDRWLQKLPENERVRLYYAEGPTGLETDIKGTVNSEAIDLAGAVNVATSGLDENVRRIQVSIEQILTWDPEVIIISTDADAKHEVYNTILTSGEWKGVRAVQNQKVYEIPCEPYDWISRPPSIFRILGVKWLANLLYPDLYEVDLIEETKQFYKEFFHYELTDQEAAKLLNPVV
ncbi:ABC transporter substrate-binding protein [Thermacetogenium phaeum]|nr:ABC transporter substrate-binding protein [Thermacetogenium phaeum]